jgi:Tfp pilus assembly protein PilX
MLQHLPTSSARQQQGATLVVAMMVLVLIMMIGIAAVNTSSTQYTLAGNLQFEDSALNNAESAVADAENWLKTNYTNDGFTDRDEAVTGQLYPMPASGAAPVDPLTLDWSSAETSVSVGGNTSQRYFIQLLSRNNSLLGSNQAVGGRKSAVCNKVNTYLISGRGLSARGASKIVQSYYSVQNCS